jgi:hypothetical protein
MLESGRRPFVIYGWFAPTGKLTWYSGSPGVLPGLGSLLLTGIQEAASPTFINLALSCAAVAIVWAILDHFIPVVAAGPAVIVTNDKLISRDFGEGASLFATSELVFSLEAIAQCYISISQRTKRKRGLRRLAPGLNLLLTVCVNKYLQSWLYGREQHLNLLGHDGQLLADIEVSGFYEEDIQHLLSLLVQENITYLGMRES